MPKFNCDFDEVGNCYGYRTRMKVHGGHAHANVSGACMAAGMGCCYQCAKRTGYFSTWDKADKKRFERLKGLFLPVFGFWRFDGCILSDDEKSNVCKHFMCYELQIKERTK